MPRMVRSSVSRRNRRGKKVAWYNRKYSTLQLAKKAWMATKYLKGLVNSERHYFDQSITLGMSDRVVPLCGIAQGDATSDRNGNSILVRSLYVRGFMQVNSAVSVNSRVSLVLVQDLQQVSDTIPTVLDIFNSTEPEAMLNTSNTNTTSGRFKIIWRKNYNLTIASGSRPSINFDKYWKLYTHVKYNGPTATDIQKNGLYFVVLTSEGTNFPTVTMNSRLGYHDN